MNSYRENEKLQLLVFALSFCDGIEEELGNPEVQKLYERYRARLDPMLEKAILSNDTGFFRLLARASRLAKIDKKMHGYGLRSPGKDFPPEMSAKHITAWKAFAKVCGRIDPLELMEENPVMNSYSPRHMNRLRKRLKRNRHR